MSEYCKIGNVFQVSISPVYAPGRRPGRVEIPSGKDGILHVPGGQVTRNTDIGVKLSFRSDLDKRGEDGALTYAEIEKLEKLLRMLVARWMIHLKKNIFRMFTRN